MEPPSQSQSNSPLPAPPSWPPQDKGVGARRVHGMQGAPGNSMQKWKRVAQTAGKFAVAYKDTRRAIEGVKSRAEKRQLQNIQGTLLMAKKNMFGVTRFVSHFVKVYKGDMYVWKSKHEAKSGLHPRKRWRLKNCIVIPNSLLSSSIRRKYENKYRLFQIGERNAYGDITATTSFGVKQLSDGSEEAYFAAWEGAITQMCVGGVDTPTRSRVASDLQTDDERINQALREAAAVVSEFDVRGSGKIGLDLVSNLLARLGAPVEHQSGLAQDLLSAPEAQATLHMGYIEDQCFFSWYANLKKCEMRAGAGGIHAARLVMRLQSIGLSLPLPLNPINDVDAGSWNQSWQEALEAEAAAESFEDAVRMGMALADLKGKFLAESTKFASIVAAQHLLPRENRIIRSMASSVIGAEAAYVHNGLLFQIFKTRTGAAGSFEGDASAEVLGASLIQSAASSSFREALKQKGGGAEDDGEIKMLCTVLATCVRIFGLDVLVTTIPPIRKSATQVHDEAQGVSKSTTMRNLLHDTMGGAIRSDAPIAGHTGFDGRYYILGTGRILPRTRKGDMVPLTLQQLSERSGENAGVASALSRLDGMESLPLDGSDITELLQKCGAPGRCLGRIAQDTALPHVREAALVEMIAFIVNRNLYTPALLQSAKNKLAEMVSAMRADAYEQAMKPGEHSDTESVSIESCVETLAGESRQAALKTFNSVLGCKTAENDPWTSTICPALTEYFGYAFGPDQKFLVSQVQLFYAMQRHCGVTFDLGQRILEKCSARSARDDSANNVASATPFSDATLNDALGLSARAAEREQKLGRIPNPFQLEDIVCVLPCTTYTPVAGLEVCAAAQGKREFASRGEIGSAQNACQLDLSLAVVHESRLNAFKREMCRQQQRQWFQSEPDEEAALYGTGNSLTSLFDSARNEVAGHDDATIHRAICSSDTSSVLRSLIDSAELFLQLSQMDAMSEKNIASLSRIAYGCARLALGRTLSSSKYAYLADTARVRAHAVTRGFSETSRALLSESMTFAEHRLGNAHPFVGQYCRLQSVLACNAGMMRDAQSSAYAACEIMKRALGSNHRVVASYTSHCAGILSWWKSGLECNEKDLQLAVLMREKALLITQTCFGPGSADTAQALYELANTLGVQGNVEQALRLAIKARKSFLASSDARKDQLVNSLVQLGALCSSAGQAEKGVDYLEDALTMIFAEEERSGRRTKAADLLAMTAPPLLKRAQRIIQAIVRLKMRALPLSYRAMLREIVAQTPGVKSSAGDGTLLEFVIAKLLGSSPLGKTNAYIDSLFGDIQMSMERGDAIGSERAEATGEPSATQQLACLLHMFGKNDAEGEMALLGVWETPSLAWPFRPEGR